MKPQNQSQQIKNDVGTLSNSLSGDTKQDGVKSQDDTNLQIFERRGSLPVDNQSADTLK